MIKTGDGSLLVDATHLRERCTNLAFYVADHPFERGVQAELGLALIGIDAELDRRRTIGETGSHQIAHRRDHGVEVSGRGRCKRSHVGGQARSDCDLDRCLHMVTGVVDDERLNNEFDAHRISHAQTIRESAGPAVWTSGLILIVAALCMLPAVSSDLRVDINRLQTRLADLAAIGAIEGTEGSSRLALTDEDKLGRDLVVDWMRDLGLDVSIDAIGNAVGVMAGEIEGPPVMCGSHIDTVRTGGRYDGNLGVLAGLEIIETVAAAGITPHRPLAVAFFTNEEGARFSPDMLGSLAYVGGIPLEEARAISGIDGASVGEELDRIGYAGHAPVPGPAPHAFVELHVEQGPVLEAEEVTIGAVTSVQGISWTEVSVTGQSNHAGTTPMNMRKDPGFVAAACATFVRDLCEELGGTQVGTVGRVELLPNLVNVVPASATFTIDLRNTDEAILQHAERRFEDFLRKTAAAEDCTYETRTLARFEPVEFDRDVVSLVANTAAGLGYSVKTLPSGAGHDAQMLARVCPTAMVFTPSHKGLSHNPAEFTSSNDLEAGANVLMHTMLALASRDG